MGVFDPPPLNDYRKGLRVKYYCHVSFWLFHTKSQWPPAQPAGHLGERVPNCFPAQDGPKMASTKATMALDGPRCRPRRPRWPHDGLEASKTPKPKRPPGGPQEANIAHLPYAFYLRSRVFGFPMAQIAPRGLQDGLKTAQEASKRGPTRP